MRENEKPPPRPRDGGHENEQPAKPLDHNLTDNDDARATTERLSFKLVVVVAFDDDGPTARDLSREIERLARAIMSRNAPPPERLGHLARTIHALGERPLFELFRELAKGAPVVGRLEKYASLAWLEPFIEAFDGCSVRKARLLAAAEEEPE